MSKYLVLGQLKRFIDKLESLTIIDMVSSPIFFTLVRKELPHYKIYQVILSNIEEIRL